MRKHFYGIAYLPETQKDKDNKKEQEEDIIQAAVSDCSQGGFQFVDHAAKQTSAFQVNVKPVLPNYEIDRLSIANVPIWKVF